MSVVFLTVLSLSLTGSVLALILFALKPALRFRFSQRWQYYIWLIVLARLLLPFSPEMNLVNTLLTGMSAPQISMQTPASGAETDENNGFAVPNEVFEIVPGDSHTNTEPADIQAPSATTSFPWNSALTYAGYLWAAVALLLLGRKVVSYVGLIREIRATSVLCGDSDTVSLVDTLSRSMRISPAPALYVSDAVPSPMLIGLLRQQVILPSDAIGQADLQYVLQHELVHYKRFDILYKWLAELAACVHWFNPLVYLVRREITRNCELACDEAVLRGADEQGRRDYGEAILSAIKPNKALAHTGVSVSMSEDTKIIKERLDAIMKFKKPSTWVICLSAVLAVTLMCGATFAGAYTPSAAVAEPTPTPTAPGGELHREQNTVTIRGETWNLIDNEEQLRGLGRGDYPMDGKYMLNTDIVLDKSVDWVPIGTEDNPFTGVFVGNGHEIANLTITNRDVQYIGMFGYAQNAEIYNVALRNPDIESAFTPGSSIAPVLAFGINCSSFDNEIIDPVESEEYERTINDISYQQTSTGYKSRTESLIENFAPYTPYGVTYNPDEDAVYYNGERVKLFVVFQSYKEEGMTYAFDLCYHDRHTDSTVYLEAVRNSSGAVQEIRPLDAAVAENLLTALEGAAAYRDDSADKPDNGEIRHYNFDATFGWLNLSLTATDKFSRGDLDSAVVSWLSECDRQQGAYTLTTGSAGSYTTYVYYNSGGRYPWTMNMEDGKLNIRLYSDTHLTTSDGWHLMYFTAPQEYADLALYLDGVKIELR